MEHYQLNTSHIISPAYHGDFAALRSAPNDSPYDSSLRIEVRSHNRRDSRPCSDTNPDLTGSLRLRGGVKQMSFAGPLGRYAIGGCGRPEADFTAPEAYRDGAEWLRLSRQEQPLRRTHGARPED